MTTEDSMSMQSESKDSKARNHQSTRDGTTDSAGGFDTGSTGSTGDVGATGGSAASEGSQQSGQQSSQQSSQQNAMPPSETDDDQYDQGTVQQVP
jgi:hypothetical protein